MSKRPPGEEKSKADKALQSVLDALSRDDEGKLLAGPFWKNRSNRRGGSGQPRSRIFSEKMDIPKKRR